MAPYGSHYTSKFTLTQKFKIYVSSIHRLNLTSAVLKYVSLFFGNNVQAPCYYLR